MQLLKNHPKDLSNYDLDSLKNNFKIPKEVIVYIELRGVIPNNQMNELRIKNKQLPLYLKSFNV